ncbi:hypothetical protein F2Q69_00023242 [Brassica cretica]|uniref:Uncharacterized protein n=1 Tax=Brassica cretica TaxID=69181 RepID=A0A8S9QNY6_BRACR|nr:hypothetical protein F2Q69_00023242 [Brassica cretica]
MELTMYEKETTRLAVGQMITITKAMHMQRRDESDQQREEATGERKHLRHPIDRANRSSIDNNLPPSIDIYSYPKAIDGCALQVSREDIADILQMANGADNFFMQQRTILAHQQRVTKEFYDAAGGIDNRFQQKNEHHTRPSIDVDVPPSIDRRPEFGRRAFDLFGTIKFYWEENDEYGVYIDDQGYARDMNGHIISVSKDDIIKLMERASRDEHNYICLP